MTHRPLRPLRILLRPPLAVAWLACLSCIWPATATAQHHLVQRCTVDGGVVFQSAPCLRETTGVVPAAPASARRTEGPAKRKSLADALRDHDATDRPTTEPRAFAGDGARLLPERMGAR